MSEKGPTYFDKIWDSYINLRYVELILDRFNIFRFLRYAFNFFLILLSLTFAQRDSRCFCPASSVYETIIKILIRGALWLKVRGGLNILGCLSPSKTHILLYTFSEKRSWGRWSDPLSHQTNPVSMRSNEEEKQ